MERTIAISDIHGCNKTFRKLLFEILEVSKKDRIILLGDYIDRGPGSKEVLDLISGLSGDGFDITALKGNHEQMMLDAIDDPVFESLWILNGGDTTLRSLGVMSASDIPLHYQEFLTSMPYFASEGQYLFVHASFNDSREDPLIFDESMIWECREVHEGSFFKGKTVIHGHRPKTKEQTLAMINEKRGTIAIDNGCVYSHNPSLGFLSALEVNTMKLYSVKNIDKI
jgi:serine/threonine protein phosphatase 1